MTVVEMLLCLTTVLSLPRHRQSGRRDDARFRRHPSMDPDRGRGRADIRSGAIIDPKCTQSTTNHLRGPDQLERCVPPRALRRARTTPAANDMGQTPSSTPKMPTTA